MSPAAAAAAAAAVLRRGDVALPRTDVDVLRGRLTRTYLVFDDGDLLAVLRREDVIQKRGLAASEESSQAAGRGKKKKKNRSVRTGRREVTPTSKRHLHRYWHAGIRSPRSRLVHGGHVILVCRLASVVVELC